jgi:CDP-2,3-bis-(O-geranylgeranyl)-sn-glycerol synthase
MSAAFDLLWPFAPIVGSLALQAPVLRGDLLAPLARPIDGGATFRGRRVLGDNKTWRGALVMFSGAVLAALVLSHSARYWSGVPDEIRRAGPLVFGALVGLGTVLAELPNSFLKRQIGIEPGRQRRSPLGVAITIFDQGDFVLGVWACLTPLVVLPARQVALAFGAVVALHLVVNVIGYLIGARKTLL